MYTCKTREKNTLNDNKKGGGGDWQMGNLMINPFNQNIINKILLAIIIFREYKYE